MYGADKTQAICMRPEKNNKIRICFVPTLHLAATMIFNNTTQLIFGKISRSIIGPIFCHVRNTRPSCLDIFVIIGAPQKWKGASLAFINNPNINHFHNIAEVSVRIPLMSRDNEPTLCTMKYNMEIFFIVHFVEIKGKNDIKLISIIIHMMGHLSADRIPGTLNNTPVHIQSFETTIIPFKNKTNNQNRKKEQYERRPKRHR